jgi:hypothetical protein
MAAEQRKNSSGDRPTKNVQFGGSTSSSSSHRHHNRGSRHRSNSRERANSRERRPNTPKGGNSKPVLWTSTSEPIGSPDEWFFDTGATYHTTGWSDNMIDIKPTNEVITASNNGLLKAAHQGDIILDTPSSHRKMLLRDTLYVPGITANLLSFRAISDSGCHITSDPETGELQIYHGSELIISMPPHPTTGIPYFKASRIKPKAVTMLTAAMETPEIWHQRFGHLGYDNMQRLVSETMVKGINVSAADFKAAADHICDTCAVSKSTRGPFRTSDNKTTAPLQLLHSDVCGPINVETPGKARYVATLLDDYTSYSIVQPLKSKAEVFTFIKEGISFFETQTGTTVKAFRSDNGREYDNANLAEFMATKGIDYQHSMPYAPEQNGKAERLNRALLQKAIPMLEASGLEHRYWGEAIVHANYVRNRSPVLDKPATPYEALFKQTPDVSNLVTFGCRAYHNVPKFLRKNKLDTPAERAIMIGYPASGKGYRLLTDKGTVIERAVGTVTFNELEFPLKESNINKVNLGYSGSKTINFESYSKLPTIRIPLDEPQPTAPAAPSGPAYRTRSRTNNVALITATNPDSEPGSYKEAISCPEAPFWIEAMDNEMAGLYSNYTWELGYPPKGTKLLGCKWVLKKKRHGDGALERFKARLVAKGFQQREGHDFFEVYAPVGKYTSLRAIMALAAQEGLYIHNVDISNAFLNGTLEEVIWMQQPEGYFQGEPGMACKLLKSIYGLKQAPRVWHLDLDEVIKEKSFKASDADPCVYYYTGTEYDARTFMLVYVDDLAIVSKCLETIAKLKAYLKSKYKLRDLGEATLFLGITIERSPAGIKLAQQRLVNDLATKYGMQDSNGRQVPMSPSTKLTKDENSEPLDTAVYPYATLVGSLMHLANCTRPDIAYAVGVLARFMSAPKMSHWLAAKGVLRYLCGTRDYGIFYSANSSSKLTGYTDSDFARDVDTRRSTAGYTFILANGAISWSSKRQATVATSTTEAEYIAAAAAVKEALFERTLLRDLGISIDTVEIYGDNQSALALANNPVSTSRAKHIDVAYHFTRERVLLGDVAFSYIPTDQMVADTLTKALPAAKFEFCNKMMGVC